MVGALHWPNDLGRLGGSRVPHVLQAPRQVIIRAFRTQHHVEDFLIIKQVSLTALDEDGVHRLMWVTPEAL